MSFEVALYPSTQTPDAPWRTGEVLRATLEGLGGRHDEAAEELMLSDGSRFSAVVGEEGLACSPYPK